MGEPGPLARSADGAPRRRPDTSWRCGTLNAPRRAPAQPESETKSGTRRGTHVLARVERVAADGTRKSVPRILGSRPLKTHGPLQLPPDQRDAMRDDFERRLRAAPEGSRVHMQMRFRILLMQRGDYVGGVNPKTMKCKNDGNVFIYSRHFLRFFDAGIVSCEDDLLCERKRQLARWLAATDAEARASRQKVDGVRFENLTEKQKRRVINHLVHNAMHGFDDFASCIRAERARVQ